MSIGGAIRTLLLANADIVSSGAAIYPGRARSNDLSIGNPVIIYNVDVDPENNKGDAAEPRGVANINYSVVQIDVYALSYDSSIEIAGYVLTALDRKSGTYDDVIIDTIVFENQTDQYDDLSKADRTLMTFRIRIKK